MKIRFCGDVHQEIDAFSKMLETSEEHVCQLGDLGVGQSHTPRWKFNNLHCDHGWSFIQGNHDNPVYSKECKHFLGRYGFDDILKMFWISGAFSPENQDSWWRAEQLSKQEMIECMDIWQRTKPKVVVTHSAPLFISKKLGFPKRTFTKQFLEDLFSFHKPDVWLFGHYHQSFKKTIAGTDFICLDKMETLTLDL